MRVRQRAPCPRCMPSMRRRRSQRHQRRPRCHHPQPKLPSQIKRQPRCPHLRNRKPPCRHHQHRSPILPHHKLPVLLHGRHPMPRHNLHPRRRALGLQHRHNLRRAPIAKQLPQRLLVPGNPMLLDELNELQRRIPRQCRLRKMWVLAQEVLGLHDAIREVAPPPARNQNLPAHLLVMLQHHHAAAPLAHLHRAEQARGSAA